MFWVQILNFFDVDPGWKKFVYGMEKNRIRDPGWKHPGSATLDIDQAGPGAAGEEEAGGGAGGRGGGRHHRPRHGGRLEKRGWS